MRADPTDRILTAEPEAWAPKISVPRIFGLSLILPFAHPIRLVLASILPAGILTWLILGPLGRLISTWEQMMAGFDMSAAGAPMAITPSAETLPMASGADFLWLYGGLLLTIALWLCFWQRAAARGFAEPIARWLALSLLRLPGYLAAFLVWALAPAVVMMAVFGGLGWLVQRNLLAAGTVPDATPGTLIQTYADTLSPLQWWAVGLTALLGTLFALWLNARLLPLPALVARQGWRRSFGQAWGFSRGHGFGLSVSLLGYVVLMAVVIMIVFIALIGILVARAGGAPDPTTAASLGGALDLLATGLLVLWQGSLGALVVRDGLAGEVDPALFD